jgi:hypothetical protein
LETQVRALREENRDLTARLEELAFTVESIESPQVTTERIMREVHGLIGTGFAGGTAGARRAAPQQPVLPTIEQLDSMIDERLGLALDRHLVPTITQQFQPTLDLLESAFVDMRAQIPQLAMQGVRDSGIVEQLAIQAVGEELDAMFGQQELRMRQLIYDDRASLGRELTGQMPAIIGGMRVDRHDRVHVQEPPERPRPFNTGLGSLGFRPATPGLDAMGQSLEDQTRAMAFRV